ncbi:unnamed protein product [Schistocephalus solidus]|uniref:Lysophospholipid acyltransferase 7 n=1 Tax=Schistocephalus solidus TaxID=70667 RepID=A0A183SAI3_SCHSO|nr:unnamed protein product [Schistocephalus solidus]
MFDGWNIGTTRWLRECVYDRVPKQFSVVAVFFVSAFWHGFYPVYYLCFLTAALLTSTGRHTLPSSTAPFFHRKLLEPLHVQYTNPPLSDVLSQLSGRRLLTVEQWECTQVLGTEGVNQEEVVFRACSQKKKTVIVTATETMGTLNSLPDTVVRPGAGVELAKDDRSFYFLGHVAPLIIFCLLPYLTPSTTPEVRLNAVEFAYEINLDPTRGVSTSSQSSMLSKEKKASE